MEQDLKISVIIPVYNVKNYIKKCVYTVCNQTYTNLEIILVDDGATDGSAEICDKLSDADCRIRVIHKENGGLSDARNAAMDVMTGDYVGFVDGDDWIEPTMYEKLLKACKEQNCEVACCRYREVTDINEVKEQSQLSFNGNGIETAEEETEDFLRDSIFLPIHDAVIHYIKENPMPAIYHSAWSKLYKVDLIKNMRFIKGRKSEDIPFAGELFSKIDALAYVDEELYNYNKIREGSIMNVKSMEHTFDHEIPGWREEIAFFASTEELKDLSDLALFYFYWRILSYAKIARVKSEYQYKASKEQKETEGESHLYARLRYLLLDEKASVKRVCKHPLVNKKYAIRLKVFLLSPKLYWFLDGLR